MDKAFDSVPPERFVIMLETFGVSSKVFSLFLKERKQRVAVAGSVLEWARVTSGVPQGSVLGPLLFIIFINDMCFLNLRSKLYLYADDTTLSAFGKTISIMITNIESDLLLIAEWLKHNKLIINVKKSQAMYFNSNQKTKKI